MYRLQCPVSLKTVPDGDHRLSRPEDIKLIENALEELLNCGLAGPSVDLEDPDD